jgi:hypothetical protein
MLVYNDKSVAILRFTSAGDLIGVQGATEQQIPGIFIA